MCLSVLVVVNVRVSLRVCVRARTIICFRLCTCVSVHVSVPSCVRVTVCFCVCASPYVCKYCVCGCVRACECFCACVSIFVCLRVWGVFVGVYSCVSLFVFECLFGCVYLSVDVSAN